MSVPDRITEYLANGGLINPELMDHKEVRALIIDCKDTIEDLEVQLERKLQLAQVPCKDCGHNIITTHCYDCLSGSNVKLLRMIDAVKELPDLLTEDAESREQLTTVINAALERGAKG